MLSLVHDDKPLHLLLEQRGSDPFTINGEVFGEVRKRRWLAATDGHSDAVLHDCGGGGPDAQSGAHISVPAPQAALPGVGAAPGRSDALHDTVGRRIFQALRGFFF